MPPSHGNIANFPLGKVGHAKKLRRGHGRDGRRLHPDPDQRVVARVIMGFGGNRRLPFIFIDENDEGPGIRLRKSGRYLDGVAAWRRWITPAIRILRGHDRWPRRSLHPHDFGLPRLGAQPAIVEAHADRDAMRGASWFRSATIC